MKQIPVLTCWKRHKVGLIHWATPKGQWDLSRHSSGRTSISMGHCSTCCVGALSTDGHRLRRKSPKGQRCSASNSLPSSGGQMQSTPLFLSGWHMAHVRISALTAGEDERPLGQLLLSLSGGLSPFFWH